MCGIFGLWHRDGKPIDLVTLQRATSTIKHRGPDDEGYLIANTQSGHLISCSSNESAKTLGLPNIQQFASEPFDLAFGFRRLAIQDLSPAGHQPMASEDGRYWIVFNGEIYNFIELRQELQSAGYELVSGSDTEVLLAAYQHWGIDCLQRFNGMWAFAIWDRAEQTLLIARDRFGIKPLYFAIQNNNFSFASEIKALLASQEMSFRPHDELVYRFLVAGNLPDPRQEETFFQGISSLPAGQYLLVHQGGEIVRHTYWELDWEEGLERSLNTTSPKVAIERLEQFKSLLTDAIRFRLRADVPVGTCLSGGLDSSSIVATINTLLDTDTSGERRQKSFSAVYETDGRYNERSYIEQMLQLYPTVDAHFTVPTVERLHDDLTMLVWHQDEPFLSTSIFAQWCVMSAAKESGVKVLLDGQGADELLGGYQPYGVYLQPLLWSGRWNQLQQEIREISNVSGVSSKTLTSRIAARAIPTTMSKQLHMLNWHRKSHFSILNEDLVQKWRSSISTNYPFPRFKTLEEQLHYQLTTSLTALLRYEDRNSMAFGIEARVPFLDHRLVEFVFEYGSDLRIHQGWTKWLLRESMHGRLPEEIQWRRDKVGFETPQTEWLSNLIQLGRGLFGDDAKSKSYLNMSVVREQLHTLNQEKSQSRNILWRLINLELWLRAWNNSGALSK